MEEVTDGLWKVGDHTTAESVASQAVPAVVGVHATKLGSPGHYPEHSSGSFGGSAATMVGWLPYPMSVPWGPGHAQGQRPCLRQRKGGGEGVWAWACGQRQGEPAASPSLLPRDEALRCWAPPPPQDLIIAAVLCPQWGLSSTAPLAWLSQVEPQGGGSQECSSGGSPRVASGKALLQVRQIRSNVHPRSQGGSPGSSEGATVLVGVPLPGRP